VGTVEFLNKVAYQLSLRRQKYGGKKNFLLNSFFFIR